LTKNTAGVLTGSEPPFAPPDGACEPPVEPPFGERVVVFGVVVVPVVVTGPVPGCVASGGGWVASGALATGPVGGVVAAPVVGLGADEPPQPAAASANATSSGRTPRGTGMTRDYATGCSACADAP
jgi:hypothetical protein